MIPTQATTDRLAPTPRLTIDLDVVAERYDRLCDALPGVRMHYAVKANPDAAILRLLVARGCAFDVASIGEIDACLTAGADPSDLSFANPAKKERDIAYAAALGVDVFVLDDASELAKLHRAAPGSTLLVRIATSGAGADWSLSGKFGCDEGTARTLLRDAAALGHSVGVAFHVGSQQRDPGQWDAALSVVSALAADLRRDGVELAVVDIGGGFPGTYDPAVLAINAYGDAIRASVERHLAGSPARIIAEPGRYLVADAGVLETEVVLVAWRGPQRWVYLDVGLFGGLAEALDEAIRYPATTSHDGGPTGPVVLAGPTCDSVDVLYRSYELPLALQAGDRVRLHATGAYTASYSSVGFNGLPPLAVQCTPATARSGVPATR